MKRHITSFRRLVGGLALCTTLQATIAFADPLVNIEAPVSSDPLVLGQSTRIQATVQLGEGDEPISDVLIYVNDNLLGSGSPAGGVWSMDYTPSSLGPLSIRAEAIDTADPIEIWPSDIFFFDVIQTDAPVTSILAPADGSLFLPGTNVPVQVLATDNDGLVETVQFFLNGEIVGATSAPFRTEIQLPSIGDYTLIARAIDNNGAQTDSVPITLRAGPLDNVTPRVVLDFPLPLGGGDTVNDVSYASSMFINATAKDPDGTIADVIFYINGQELGSAEHMYRDVYSLFFDPNALGNYIISAKAIDNEGREGWSVPMVLDVGPLERPLPKAEMIQPFHTSILGRVVPIYVEASGGLIPIDRVDFFANGIFLGSVNEPVVDDLYSFNWVPENPEEIGTYDLQARVVQIDPADATWDNWTIAEPVQINIVEPPAGGDPSISILNPVEGNSYTVLNPIALQADALDPLGSILAVRFYANGQQLGMTEEGLGEPFEDEAYPYTLSYTPRSPGLYQFVAELESDRGFRLQSDPVTVVVNSSQLPAVEITYPTDGALITVGTPILITADQQSTGGGTMELDFYANGVFIGTDATYPFSQIWTPQSIGDFEIVIKAREIGTNGVATSDEVNIEVMATNLPTGSIVIPDDKDPTVGSDLLIEVDADDPDGYVASVEIFVNGASITGADTAKPFSSFWQPGSEGTYNISALIIDNSGNQVVTSRNVRVGGPTGVPPRVTISATGSGNVTPGSRIVVGANVYDDDPDNVVVTFFMNGAQIGEPDSEAPYSVIVDPEIGGGVFNNAYSLTAVATDTDGNSRADTLSPLYISDFSVNQPYIDIININEGDRFTRGSRLPIRVEIGGGALQDLNDVVFYADGVEIGRVDSGEASGRFSFDWIPDRTGTIQVTAASLLNEEFYDHDRDGGGFDPTPRIPVTPVNVAFPVNIVVEEPIGVLPSVSLDIFPTRTELAIGSKVMIYADAQDVGGGVEQVQFFVDGEPVPGGIDTQAPFTYTYTTDQQGFLAVHALATDTDGNVVTSTVVNLDVLDRVITTTPAINLTVPASGQEGNPLSLRANTESFVSGPESVVFYVNGQPVGEDATFPYAYTWLANLTGELTFFASAKQTLFDGSVVTTVSDVVESFMTDNVPPVIDSFSVSFTGQDSVTKPNPYLGNALTFAVEMSDTGPINSVELFRDGEAISSSENSVSPFEIIDIPSAAGTYQYSVLVTDRGGLETQSGTLTIRVVEDGGSGPVNPGGGSIPEIISFTSDVVGSSSLVSLPITFTVDAEDENGIEKVELYLNGGEVVSTVGTEPYEMEFIPLDAGSYTFKAVVTNVDGNSKNSLPITIQVRQPNPLNQNTDFVYQTYLDLLMRAPTLDERNSASERLDTGDLSRDRFIREIMDFDENMDKEYDSVRSVILTNRFLLNQWPSRQEIESDVSTVRDGGLIALVSSMMPYFEPIYVQDVSSVTGMGSAVSGLPTKLSPEREIDAYIKYLFVKKFGVNPTESQLKLGRLYFLAGGRDVYTQTFIEDLGVIATSSAYITLGLGFKFEAGNAPSDTYLREADAASLQANLLRISPTDSEVSELASQLFASQVSTVLNDPRYAGRFATAFGSVQQYANGWKYSDWFGWYNTNASPWIYHSENGWVYFKTVGQSADNFWYFDTSIGWVWTQDSLYPVIYEKAQGNWLMSLRTPYSPVDGRWFFNYNANDWVQR